MLSKYGAHIFHTSDDEVWNYVNHFSKWRPYEHRVLSKVGSQYVPVPVNINTINSLLKTDIRSTSEMRAWIRQQTAPYRNSAIRNSEDSALARFGNQELYNLMFKEYTYKQWSLYPRELEPSVLERIPIHFDYNDRYFQDSHEGIPEYGYTKLIAAMLEHPLIEVRLNTDYEEVADKIPYEKLIYTGPIDQYFKHKFGPLEYRSLRFEFSTLEQENYQPVAVVNYPSLEVPFTRIIEYKKLYPSHSKRTIIAREFPATEGEPYYPVPTERNRHRYQQYKELADQTSQDIIFAGRLANYKYFNMDQAIRNSLDIFASELLK